MELVRGIICVSAEEDQGGCWGDSKGPVLVGLEGGLVRIRFDRSSVVLSDKGRSRGLFSVKKGIGIVID